jgi:DNA-binding transcriptional MerR regulator
VGTLKLKIFRYRAMGLEMNIGEASKSVLRFSDEDSSLRERQTNLAAASRRDSNYRTYSNSDVSVLSFISRARRLGSR